MTSDTRRFLIAWTLITLVGYVAGILILLPIAITIANAVRLPILIGLISGAILGATLGLAQWFVLHRRTPISIGWVGSTVIGGMLGMALGMASEPNAAPFQDATREAAALILPWRLAWQTAIAGALFGIGMGIAQWWVFHQYVRTAGWWILANGFAWMVGLGVGALLAEMLTTIGALLLTGIIVAAITAYYMERWQWELRKRSGPLPGRH